jgi:hypothetical protein
MYAATSKVENSAQGSVLPAKVCPWNAILNGTSQQNIIERNLI